jgi:hypothetical protein
MNQSVYTVSGSVPPFHSPPPLTIREVTDQKYLSVHITVGGDYASPPIFYCTMENFMTGIYVIRRESHIKAKSIKIKTMGQRHVEEIIKLANSGISAMLSSHSRTPEGYQIFLQSETDGGLICQQILDALLHLPYDRVVLERINC